MKLICTTIRFNIHFTNFIFTFLCPFLSHPEIPTPNFFILSQLDLLGQNLLNITHEDDRALLKDQLMPKSQTLGPNGELVIPDEPNALRKVKKALAQEKKRFIVR